MHRLKRFILKILLDLFRSLSFIVPKKKGFLVFQPWHNKTQFSGNLKSLLLYVKQNYTGGEVVVLAFDTRLYNEIRREGIPVVQNFLSAYWNLIRAEHVIIDATISSYANWNLSFIQLWHGTGFKNIGLLNKNNFKKPIQFKRIEKHYTNYNLVVATSSEDAERKKDSFNTTNTLVTGSPRNDLFFREEAFQEKLKKRYNVEEFSKIISYTPTFRDYETFPPFSDSFWKKLNKYLEETNSLFIVKKHPWDKYLQVPQSYNNIKDLSAEIADVQELLVFSDLLISDYSGIITDFALTGKPILLYLYDFKEYLETSRSFYYNLEEILPQPFIYDEEALLSKIIDDSWLESKEYQESYRSFKARFHKHLDGNSSKRVLDRIIQLSRS